MTDSETQARILGILNELDHKLYGDGGFEGDIQEIKRQYKELCIADEAQKGRLRRVEVAIIVLALTVGASLGAGLDKVISMVAQAHGG